MKANSHYMLPVGTHLHGFLITQVLGQGGFGITYKAEDTRLNRYVVIKEYLPQTLAARLADKTVEPNSPEQEANFRYGLASFLKEAQTLGHFQHPNIVPVLDFFEANNTAYIVMPYLAGETLEDRLSRQGKMTGSEVNAWLFPLLDGLQTIHADGFLHRDIKPGNIYLRDNGQPVLIDFGAARNALANRSRSLSVILTPGYAPMEQYGGNAANQGPWTDIYALGGVIYRCITGNEPADSTERQDAAINGETDPLQIGFNQIAKATNPVFASTIVKCMRIARKDRIQGVAELRELLENSQKQDSGTFEKEIVLKDLIDKPQPKSNNKKIQNDLPHLILKANKGDAKAQGTLGVRYETGNGVDKNYKEAVYWYLKAAEQNEPNAQCNLGFCFECGNGVSKNYEEAVQWYKKSAENGLARAQYNLGLCYELGKGVDQNYKEALNWYLKAAAWNYAYAQYKLGYYYEYGVVVVKNFKNALLWYQKASEQDLSIAQYKLGECYEFGKGVEQNDNKAIELYTKAANQGHVDAARRLILLNPNYLDKDNSDF